MAARHTAYVGLGTNLGDRHAQLDEALRALDGAAEVALVQASGRHETAPVGGPPQPRYLNAAARLETSLPPQALLALFHEIEADAGRERGPVRNAPRTLDLDLLLYDDLVVASPQLTLPHPRMHERAFVLDPLHEIAPDVLHPLLRRTVAELRAELVRSRAESGAVGLAG